MNGCLPPLAIFTLTKRDHNRQDSGAGIGDGNYGGGTTGDNSEAGAFQTVIINNIGTNTFTGGTSADMAGIAKAPALLSIFSAWKKIESGGLISFAFVFRAVGSFLYKLFDTKFSFYSVLCV